MGFPRPVTLGDIRSPESAKNIGLPAVWAAVVQGRYRRRSEYRDFDLVVPNGPGFGVVVDEDKLAFYRRDCERRERRVPY
jgi:hypothetical protein